MQYNLTEAKTQLSKLLDEVEQGKEVVITRSGRPVARLHRIIEARGCVLGQARGEMAVPLDESFRAMSDEEADAFADGRW